MMNTDSNLQFAFNFKDILIDEIALNGLEGIGFDLLWKYIGKRLSSDLTTKMQKRLWECIKSTKCISFYEAPEPLPIFDLSDRFLIVDESTGQLLDPPDYLDGPYEFKPIENEHGSCSNYNTRTLLNREEISTMSYEDVFAKYGHTFIMVATFEERWHAIATHMPLSLISQLTPVHYCILELIAKGRANGQMTVGKTNLTKIVKESNLLFYNRIMLQKLDLIRVQCLTQVTIGRGIKSLLLRIKRFHQIRILSMPKTGKLFNIFDYLLKKPNHCERCDVIMRKGFLTQPECKKLKKTVNVFQFIDKESGDEKISTKRKKKIKLPAYQKRKFITLAPSDDESSQSEDENNDVPLECQYKVGVNLLRQGYERFIDAGLKGLTQIELAQLLGIEFYTSRTICRIFRVRNIVREFLEDKGRQRTARYIAVAATAEMDIKYAEEKKKLLQYFDNQTSVSKEDEANLTDEGVPKKKRKLEENKDDKNQCVENMDEEILEVKVLDGLQNVNHESLLNSKKSLSLRQLRFANGLLKVIQEKQAISSYHTLSALVADKIGEPPMDTKALKVFVQKLVTDGRLKILKIKWPGFNQKFSQLICAPNLTSTSPVIKAKYKDICLKSVVSRKSKPKSQLTESPARTLSHFAYPRYMKLQKLHELITEVVYFDPVKVESHSHPDGISSLLTIIPEVTIEFALGNISNIGSSDIAHLKVGDDLLKVKLRDAPTDLYRAIIQSKSMQNSMRSGLKILAHLGLIQLISHSTTENVFYVNRHARILDTTGDWPRKNSAIKPVEKKFYFETFKDVKSYWEDVYIVSINTDIVVEKRDRYNINAPLRKESEVHKFDVGLIFGDGLGPCGFHSSVFMDIPRLWNTMYLRNSQNIKTKKKKKKTIVKIPKTGKITRPSGRKMPPRKPVEQPQPQEKVLKKRISDVHIKWTPHDDEILILCKVALSIMSPVSQAGCLRVKNNTARCLLALKDPQKTGRVHRRAMALDANSKNWHKKDCILNDLRRHRNLIQKYEDILRKIKIRHCANMTKFVNEGRLVMLELVWLIIQILKKGTLTQSVPCVATDYEDFHKKYTITATTSNKFHRTYKTPITSEPQFATLKEAILLTVMHSYNRELDEGMGKKIYSIFEGYSEELLRRAIDVLRKSGALAAKDKVLNNQINRVQFDDIVRSAYKISANYKRRWLSRLNSDFVTNLLDSLDSEQSQSCIKGSPWINCALFEMHSCDVLDIISVSIPVIAGSSGSLIQESQLNVLDIEMKFKLKSGVAGWKNKSHVKKFIEIYETSPPEKHMAMLLSEPIVEYKEEQDINLEDPILSYLNDQQEKGSTFKELQEHLGCDRETLQSQLLNLEEAKVIKRVGFYENRVLLTKFLKPWLFDVQSPDKRLLIPSPWMTIDLDIRSDVLLNWMGVIMNKVFESPGCSIFFLSEHTENLSTRGIQEICMFLEKCECVKLKIIELREPDLFSDDFYVPELREFNPYDPPENMLVFPVKNSLTKYAFVRKKILDLYQKEIDV